MQPQSLAMVQPQNNEVVTEHNSTRPHDFCEQSFLNHLCDQVGNKNFENWFHKKVALRADQDELNVGVASPFLLNWMQNQFRAPLNRAAQAVLGASARVTFSVEPGLLEQQPQTSQQNALPAPGSNPTPGKQTQNDQQPLPFTRQPKSTHTSHTGSQKPRTGRKFANLNDFIPGESNQLAYTAAIQVCQNPGERINPLYLHGNVGLGKSHLLEGIYKTIRQLHPELNVMLLTAEAFSNYFTLALRDKTLPSFRQKFRNVDVLLVDDIDFLESKSVIQEEFLHTFKQLESKGGQVILTADRHPRLLTKSSTELTSRFISGLVCKIEAPGKETRFEILKYKARQINAELSEAVLDFVAQKFQHNVRELEGALNCLETHRTLLPQKRLSVASARKILAELERDCIQVVRSTDIEHLVCEFFGVTEDELRSTSRSRQISIPRMIAIYLTRKHTEAAYKEIGQQFGGRNHSTVMSAEKKIKHFLDHDATIKIANREWQARDLIETLERQLLAA